MSASAQEIGAVLASLTKFDPQRLTQEVIKDGEGWADQDAAASALEETKKTMLASLTLEYLAGSHSGGGIGERPKPLPVSQAEIRALADPRYEQHLDLMVQARKEAHRSRVRYDMGKMRLELMRSLQATLRNELRLGGQYGT